jgi:hypothetical protein
VTGEWDELMCKKPDSPLSLSLGKYSHRMRKIPKRFLKRQPIKIFSSH